MNCLEAEALIVEQVDSMLPAYESGLLQDHLTSCPDCRLKIVETRELMEALRAAPLPGLQSGPSLTRLGDRERGPQRLPSTPRILGDFEIIEELGRGGMAVVYRATQRSLNRVVALKVMRGDPRPSDKAVQRFHTEARAAARLKHPNIVPVYAQGEDEGQLHYAMELIEGPSLGQLLERQREAIGHPQAGRPDFRRLAADVAEVADALHYAHEHGVVHRDIKPQNLLREPDGHLRITDFGLARALEEPSVTVTGDVLGTPAYMSPEQSSARGPVDRRSDIFSLGATFYEMLTLHRPFDAATRDQVIAQIRGLEPVAPRTRDPGIPVDLETICLRALDKDPARRYQTAGLLAEDLRLYLQDRPIRSRRAGPWLRFRKWVRRHPPAGVALALLPLAILLGGYAAHSRANHRVRQAWELLTFQDYQRTAEARTLLHNAGWLWPDDNLYEITAALAYREDPGIALEHLQAALQRDPENVTALYLKAWILRNSHPAAATECLATADQLCAGQPPLPEQWFLRGLAVLGIAEREEEAMESFRQASRLHEDYEQALLHLGRAVNYWMFHQRSLEQFELGSSSLRSVAGLRPNQAYPHYLLSIAYRLAGEIRQEQGLPAFEDDFTDARAHAGSAQDLEPRNPLGYIVEAELLDSLRQFDAAIARYDQAMDIALEDDLQERQRDIHEYRWRLLYWTGHTRRALDDLSARLEPVDLSGSTELFELWFAGPMQALLRKELGARDDAVADAARTPARHNPQQPAAVMASAAGLWLIGDQEAAAELLEDGWADVVWGQTLFPYESAAWNRLLYDFCLDEATLEDLQLLADRRQDPSWLMSAAWLLDGIKKLSAGERAAALERFSDSARTHDYQRYSYMARTLLHKMELEPDWPAWLARHGA